MAVIFQFLYLIIIFPIALILLRNFFQSKKLAAAKSVTFQISKWVILVLLLPIIVLLYVVFKILQQLVKLILIVKHGNKFGGQLANQDAMFAVEYPKQVIVNSLFLIECDKSPEEFQDMVKDTLRQSLSLKLKHNPKIFGTLNVFLGYPYLLKNQVNFDDCIKKLPTVEGETISKAELFKLNEECFNELLPNDNKALWDIRIGPQHVDWYKNEEKKLYPILFRFSHVLTDGVHIFKGILGLLGDVKVVEEPTTENEKVESNNKLLEFFLLLQSLADQVWCLLTWTSVLTVNSVLVTHEPYNVLFGKKLSGKKFMCLGQEDTPRLVKVAKNIKKKYTGVVLMDIFATAFIASVTDYCQKYTTDIPKFLTCAITEAPKATNLLKLTPTKLSKTQLVCTNDVGIYIPKLHSFVKSKTDKIPLVKILENVAAQNREIHQSNEGETHRWLFNTFSPIIPVFLTSPFMVNYGVHAVVSNVPGPSKINIMNGHLLDNMVFWLPHTYLTGIGLAIMSYGGILQMSLNVDSTLVPEREQVQEILDGVFKYIDLLDDATSEALKL